MFNVVQCLRGLAALLVLFHHSRLYMPAAPEWTNFGARGVDVFFVISGFVMAHSLSQRDSRGLAAATDFAVRRLLRVVPLYWVATFLLIRHDLLAGRVPECLWKDLLFIAHESIQFPGRMYPVLVPGWTLNYEMFFYGLLAVALLFTRNAARTIGAVLLLMTGIGWCVKPPNSSVAGFYTSPFLVLFVAGMILHGARSHLPRLGAGPAASILVAALIVMCAPLPGPRLVAVGIPALIAVGAAVQLSSVSTASFRLPIALGDASYSIYLLQGFGIGAGRRLIELLGFAPAPNGAGAWLAALVLCVFGTLWGLAVYRWLERPVYLWSMRWWRDIWSPRNGPT
ncbi:MAG: acyltransferase [Gammaproteobacteria bacterium]|nr:acyltransferase [Gammaproteobacteria bacterium]